jgi:branched-chain amino acid transport system ATP-binding protein
VTEQAEQDQAPEPAADAGADGDAILAVRDVAKHFGGIHAVDGASFEVRRGSITALIGPNGAGKTTLFNIVTGFQRGDRGEVVYDGTSIFRRPPHVIARRRMVRTFQITKALAAMPVIDNMTLAAPDQPGEKLTGLLFRAPAARRREKEVHERAHELLDVFGLREKADEYAGTLSGGQRKLLELARALMVEPRLVLLDHMHTLRDRDGVTFLFIEHDMDVVMAHSDEVIVMAQGATIASGPPEEVRNDRAVIDAYLGASVGT